MTDNNNNNEIKNATNHTNKASSKKNKYSDNFNSVINNLSAESPTSHNKPWYKKTGSVVAMSSTLGVGVLATVIAVPLVLTTNTTGGPSISKEESLQNAIAKFNGQTTDTKIDAYNKMATDNNNVILTYIKGVGMGYFYDENAATPISTTIPNSGSSPGVFTNFANLLNSSALFANSDLQFKPGFLTIKGKLKNTAQVIYVNLNDESNYCISFNNAATTPSNIPTYYFYSPIKDSISDVSLTLDEKGALSMTMNLTNHTTNAIFYLQDHSAQSLLATPHFASYKPVITFNDKTLFPGMSEYIKTVLLK